MGMAAVLFNDAEPFEQIDNTLRQRPSVKSGANWSSCFREGRLSIRSIHVYSPGARADNAGDKLWIVTRSVCFFDHTL